MKREGFAINEMLFMIPVMIVLMMMCTKPIRILTGDLLQDQRDLQANVSVHHMLRTVREEIERATALPEYAGSATAGGKVLLIESSEGTVCYELIDDKVIKRIVGAERNVSEEIIDTWKVGHAEINWKVLRRNGKGYAVEVITSIDRISGDRLHKKLQNSHVFFVNGPGRPQEKI
jgi:hypothetical protein